MLMKLHLNQSLIYVTSLYGRLSHITVKSLQFALIRRHVISDSMYQPNKTSNLRAYNVTTSIIDWKKKAKMVVFYINV